MTMFKQIYEHNEVQKDVGLRFGRNEETIQRIFMELLTTTERLSCNYIITPKMQELYQILEWFQPDRTYYLFFSGFVDVIDGTHVFVKVKHELQGMHWNQLDNVSLNIMAICDLNMLFTYIENGTPWSCHDTIVLTMAHQSNYEFSLPLLEKYYFSLIMDTQRDTICLISTMFSLQIINMN